MKLLVIGLVALCFVNITTAGLLPLSISSNFNQDGVSSDAAPEQGNFDGGGYSFPGENPYISGNMPTPNANFASEASTVFRMGSTTGMDLNCIACTGQTINVFPGIYTNLFVLFAPVGDTDGDVVFHFLNGASLTQRLYATDWVYVPDGPGVRTAWRCNHRHLPSGQDASWVFLSEQTLSDFPWNCLSSITLPAGTGIRIFSLSINGDDHPGAAWCEDFRATSRYAWSSVDATVGTWGRVLPTAASGSVATVNPVTVDVSRFPLVSVKAYAHEGATYSLALTDQATGISTTLLSGVTQIVEQVVNLNQRLGWVGTKSFKITIGVTGLNSTVDVRRVTVGMFPDTDGDGMPNEWEYQNALDQSDPADGAGDPDGDGLTNLQEYQWGFNPHLRNYDTDGDGLSDAWEVRYGTNPTNLVDEIDTVSFRQLGTVDTPGTALALDVNSNVLCVADGSSDLQVIDVSVPTNPVRVAAKALATYGTYTSGEATDVDVVSNLAYVTHTLWTCSAGRPCMVVTGALKIVNISSPANPVIVGSFPLAGPGRCVQVVSNIAYTGHGELWDEYLHYRKVGSSLKIVDVSTPASPSLCGAYALPTALDYKQYDLQDVFVTGGRAYLAASDWGGLGVLAVTNAYSPAALGWCDTPGVALGLSVVSNVAYVADGWGGFHAVDVTNPAAPAVIGGYAMPGYAMGSYSVCDLVFVANSAAGVRVMDVSVPTNPTEVGCFDTAGNAYNVVVVSNLAYVADGAAGVQVLEWDRDTDGDDLGDQWELRYFGSLAQNGNGDFDSDGILNRAEFQARLNPASADTDADGLTDYEEVWTCRTDPRVADTDHDGLNDAAEVNTHHTDPLDADTDDDTLPDGWEVQHGLSPANGGDGLADGDGDHLNNLQEYQNGTDPANPDSDGDTLPDGWEVQHSANPTSRVDGLVGIVDFEFLGSYDTPGSASGIDVVGSRAYVADSTAGGLQVIDVALPTNPVRLGWVDTPGYALDVSVESNRAYVADGSDGGLRVINVENAAAPTLMGSYDTSSFCPSVAAAGGIAYIADVWNDLLVISCTNPTNPTSLAACSLNGDASDVFVVSNYAYVASTPNYLNVVDISVPASPVVRSSTWVGNSPSRIWVVSNRAYLASSSGLLIYDVGTPTPTYLGGCYTVSGGKLTEADGLIYWAAGTTGVHVINVNSPSSPVRVATYDTPGYATDVRVVSNVVYVADGEAGVQVLWYGSVDRDADGMRDTWELHAFGTLTNGSGGDVDGDGLSNWGEHNAGLNPTNPDTDGDGVNDRDEVWVYHTDPFQLDTDGDGMGDNAEIRAGSDPSDAHSVLAADSGVSGSGADYVILWPSAVGRSYGVWRATNLLAGFAPLETNLPAHPPVNAYTDTVSAADGVRYYRIRLQ